MDDMIQLGAYVVIILGIGGSSVIKKIIEAQKRRKELEQSRGKTLRLDDEPRRPVAPRPVFDDEVSDREVITETDSESREAPRIEDILKEVFNIPAPHHKKKPVRKHNSGMIRTESVQAKPRDRLDREMIKSELEDVSAVEPNWRLFSDGLKLRGLNEIQQAIVLSEIIRQPKSRRAG